jgi:hypothetical protein
MECGKTWRHCATMILHLTSAFDFHQPTVYLAIVAQNLSVVEIKVKLRVEPSLMINMINEQFSFRKRNDYSTIALC